MISAATSSVSVLRSICRLIRHFLTPTTTPPRPSFLSFLYSSPHPGRIISELVTDGFSQVSHPKITSRLHASSAFQNNSFFASMLQKFSLVWLFYIKRYERYYGDPPENNNTMPLFILQTIIQGWLMFLNAHFACKQNLSRLAGSLPQMISTTFHAS